MVTIGGRLKSWSWWRPEGQNMTLYLNKIDMNMERMCTLVSPTTVMSHNLKHINHYKNHYDKHYDNLYCVSVLHSTNVSSFDLTNLSIERTQFGQRYINRAESYSKGTSWQPHKKVITWRGKQLKKKKIWTTKGLEHNGQTTKSTGQVNIL